jgi:three-Cys-motif partner protein
VKELQALRSEFGERRAINVRKATAADGIDWVTCQPISRRTHRGVAFLDPFGANLDWASVQKLAATGLFEVVVNFALSMAIQRMLPNSGDVPKAWALALDNYFGDRTWFDAVYQRGGGLFEVNSVEKRADYSERLLGLYRTRLRAAFGYVSTPRLIRNTRGAPLYYLIWAGPNKKGLEGADYILTMGERIGRRTGEARRRGKAL